MLNKLQPKSKRIHLKETSLSPSYLSIHELRIDFIQLVLSSKNSLLGIKDANTSVKMIVKPNFRMTTGIR